MNIRIAKIVASLSDKAKTGLSKTKNLQQQIVQKTKTLRRHKNIHPYYKDMARSTRKAVYYVKQVFSISPRFIFHLSLVLVVIFVSFSSTFASKRETGTVIANKVLPTQSSEKTSVRTLATLASAVNSISGANNGQSIAIIPEPSLATTSDGYLAKPTYASTIISEKQREGIITYTTVPGDTLSSLAVQFGITTSTIKWANNIVDANAIKNGQTLSILPVSGVAYVAKAGDTIDSIATAFGASAEATVKQNKLKSTTDIREGQMIIVPDGKVPEPPAPAEPAEPEPTSAPVDNSESLEFSFSGYYGGADGLMGSIGYARCGGNCVNEPGVNNPGWGNPSDWPILTTTPYIGATVLWTYNHTGVVTGIWSNGDIEVRHQNFCYPQSRFSRSEFRGFR